jgi:hypothetical protein
MKTFNAPSPIRCLPAVVGLTVTFGCGPATPTPPAEPCHGVAPGDIVVSEFMADPAGSDTGKQYIEIYNTTDHTVDLGGLTLFQSMSDRSRLNATALPSLPVSSHGYFVVGDAGDDKLTRPTYLNYGYGSALGALRHENGKVGLNCGSTVITELAYTEVSAGHARQLDGSNAPSATSLLDATQWCDAIEPLNALAPIGENYGSPGAPNHPCSLDKPDAADTGLNASRATGTGGSSAIIETDAGITTNGCLDPVSGSQRPINKPQPGDLVITEVMPAPSVNNNGPGEWFEVLATRAVDLNQIELANESTGSTVLTSETCLGVQSGSWLLFARSSDPAQNGGLPSTAALFDFTLADSGSSTYPERSVVVRLDGNVIDRAHWLKTTKGTALQRSLSSLDSGAIAKWCLAASQPRFGAGDQGTPGAANSVCIDTLVDAGDTSYVETATGTGGTAALYDTGTTITVERAGVGGTAHTYDTGGAAYFLGAGGASHASSTGGASYRLSAGGTTHAPSMGGASYSRSAGGTTSQPTDAGDGGNPLAGDSGATSPVEAGAGGAPAATDASATGDHCRDAGGTTRTPVAPRVGDLVVTEFMAAPSTNNNGGAEWFEIGVNSDLDLNGLEISNESAGSILLASDSCLHVQAGERLVFARSADIAENGGLPFVNVTFAFTLADSGTTAHPERALILRYGDVELNRVTWTKSTKGASWQRAESALDTDVSHDSGADSGQELVLWCVTPGSVTYGWGDRGTPGTQNEPCD